MSKKKRSNKKPLVKRNGFMLVALLAVMILIVSIVTMSYSWYEPAVKKGTGMSYSADVVVRSNHCTITGTKAAATENAKELSAKTGELVYDTDVTSEVTVPANQIWYFRTTIKNADSAPTNISLYLKSLPTKVGGASPSASFAEFGFGVAVPSNSYRKYTTAQNDFYIVRNAYIYGADSEEGSDVLNVDWFIKTGSASISFNPADLYLNYN